MIKYKWFALTAVITLILLAAAGCGNKNEPTAAVFSDMNMRGTVTVADPQAAVDKIYESLEEYDAAPLKGWMLEEFLGIKESDLREYYGNISEPDEGLSDVIIIRPKETRREDMQLALSKYKEQRMSEFENYDILDAYSIAQNAVIYDQGDYIILLMLADVDSARSIIDEYIPL